MNEKREIRRIVVHCSASSRHQRASEIVAYHLRSRSKGGRGWRVAGYHHIIEADGRVCDVVPHTAIANGAKGYNADSLHVCYVGGIDSSGRAVDNRTEAQRCSMERLLRELRRQYPTAEIVGHRDLSPDTDGSGEVERHEWLKACPCFDARREYSSI